MPNTFAYVALFAWPLVVVILFRRLSLPNALVWSVLGGYLFLPPETGIDLPLLPPLDKALIPSLSAAVMCLVAEIARPPRRRATPAPTVALPAPGMSGMVRICLLVLMVTPFLTVLQNESALVIGPGMVLPGLDLYDGCSMLLDTMVMLLPFLLARRHLVTREAQIALLRALVIGGLIYSALILVEVRLSPQLNRWFYGFYSHSFVQHIRAGGFRPMVFVEHGLRVGIFMAVSVLSAIVLWRAGRTHEGHDAEEGPARHRRHAHPSPGRWLAASLWLFCALVLSKNLGATAIAVVLIPVVLFCQPKLHLLAAAAIGAAVLVYPLLRGADLVPTEALHEWAASMNTDRAQSLQYRFDNEDMLLARANEKPIFGWGGYGRNRVYDPETGRDLSVTDGTWVIYMGAHGWVGYVARFALLALPLVLLAVRGPPAGNLVVSGLALVLAANLVDLLPNSGLTPVTWMLAGTLSAVRPLPSEDPKRRASARPRAEMRTDANPARSRPV